MLIGFAKDIHPLRKKKKSKIILGNKTFIDDYKIKAYSDGDLVLHALSDAILSAIGENDIGYYFSDKNKQNHGLNSKEILNLALTKMVEKGYEIINIDLTIITNHIKIIPKKEEIIINLKKLTNTSKINIKGRNFEKRNNTIECYCIVLLGEKRNNENFIR